MRWARLVAGTAGRLRRLGWQHVFYAALCVIAVAFTATLLPASGPSFGRFYGPAQPLLVTFAAGAVGGAALWVLSHFGFAILKGRATLLGIRLSALFATVLAVAIVIADVLLRYPRDINVPVPRALLFYPAIGFTAEVVFHLLPLACLLPVLHVFAGRLGRERVVWLAMAWVAVLEPTFQVVIGGTGQGWVGAYTGFHVFVIAALQLFVFRRFDFASMYAFRLVYYAYWHILWGTIRIPLLF